ncbi:MAG: HPF/RaiA family ribosome-associated protein [Thermomicrobiales bacterium]
MAVTPTIVNRAGALSDVEQKRIDRSLEGIAKRLASFTNPSIDVTISSSKQPASVDASMRVVLGVRDTVLRSSETSRTADHAVKLACDDIKRQLEKTMADLRGADTYGIPSRRNPEHLRPANQTDDSGEDAEFYVDETFDEGDERNTDAWAMTPSS